MGCSPSADRKMDRYHGGSISTRTGRSTRMSSFKTATSISVSPRYNSKGNAEFFLHNNRNFPDGDPNKGALKTRLRRQLASKVKSGTQEELTEVLKSCEDYKLPVDDLYFRAVRKVEYLAMRNTLRDAVRRRHHSILREAISKVETSPFARELHNSSQAARNLLSRLSYHWSGDPVRHTMGYSSVSEVRRFKSPPGCVVDSVKACFLIIGTPLSKLKTWSMQRALLCHTGREGILMQMAQFDPEKLSLTAYKMADSLIRKWKEEEVAMVSLEAATFWVWANNALNKKYNQLHRGKGK